MEHRDIPATEQHGIVRWLYANEAAMLAASVTADDLYKVAQVGVGAAATFHVLNSVAPNVYVAMSGTPSSPYVTNMDFSANTLTLSFSEGPDIAVVGIAADADLDALGVTVGTLDATLAAAIASVGQPNGIASLNGLGVVPDTQVPSYTYANLAAFPPVGASGKIYCALDTGKLYTPVAGPAYQEVSAGLSAIPTMTMLGNNTGGSAVPTALTQAQVRALVKWPRELDTSAAPSVANSLDPATDSYAYGDGIVLASGRKWYIVNSDTVAMAATYGNATNARTTIIGSTGIALRSVADSALLHCTTLTMGTQSTTGANPASKNLLFNVGGTVTGAFSGAPPVNQLFAVNATGLTYTAQNSGAVKNTYLQSYNCTFSSSGGNNWVDNSNDVTLSSTSSNNRISNTGFTFSVSGSNNNIWGGRGTVSGSRNQLFMLYTGTISGNDNWASRVDSVSGSYNFIFGADSTYATSVDGSYNAVFCVKRCSVSGSYNLVLPGSRDGNPAPAAISESYAVVREFPLATTSTNVVEHARVVDPVLWAATTDATATRMKVPGTSTDAGITLDRGTAAGEHWLGYIEAEVHGSLDASANTDHLIGKFRWTFNNNTLSAVTVVHTASGGTGNTWVVSGEIVSGVFYVKVTGEAGKSLTWAARVTSLSSYVN